jgi:hypothetical protein
MGAKMKVALWIQIAVGVGYTAVIGTIIYHFVAKFVDKLW